MSLAVSRIPQIFRKGAGVFTPTGTIVHDDKTEWDGTFVNMQDANDNLELAPTYFGEGFDSEIVGQNPSIPPWTTITEPVSTNIEVVNSPVAVGSKACMFDNPTSNYIIIEKLLASAHTISEITVRARYEVDYAANDVVWFQLRNTANQTVVNLKWDRTGAAAGKVKVFYYDTGGAVEIKEVNIEQYYKYKIGYNSVSGKHDIYIDDVKEVDNQDTQQSGTDIKKLLIAVMQAECYFDHIIWGAIISTGSYEHDSTAVDVGAGVVWGQFSWTEVLDGATIVAKVKTSPDDVDWTEAWQTLNSGDYITGNNRYLRYRFEITNGTALTEIDDVNITYSV